MRQTLPIIAVITTAIAVASVAAGEPQNQRGAIEAAAAAATRTPANVARDVHRHPVETLNFFGLKPGDTVVEISPGGGWYTEILAPLTAGKGTLYEGGVRVAAEDTNHDGVIDEQGIDYEHADGTKDGKPDAVVLAAGLRPDTVGSVLMNEDGTPNMGAVPVQKLDLVIRPLALDARDPAHPVPLKSVPKGKYAIIVMQFTGQTWRLPNELQPAFASHAGLPQVESQAYVIEVK